MRALILTAGLLLASCTQPAQSPTAAFQNELAGRVAGAAKQCVSTYQAENLRIIDPSTVAYGSGRTIYVNHLPGGCPALNQLNTIIVDAHTGNQYCSGDQVRGLEPEANSAGPGCNPGKWIPYRMQ